MKKLALLSALTLLPMTCLAAQAQLIDYRVTVSSPPLTDMQIEAMPSTIAAPSVTVETTRTFPAVIDPCNACNVQPTTRTFQRDFSAVMPLSTGSAILGLNAMDRLSDMMDQVRLGTERGFLSADGQASLTADHARISSLINSLAPGGLSLDEVNQIEVELNLFNQRISDSMSI